MNLAIGRRKSGILTGLDIITSQVSMVTLSVTWFFFSITKGFNKIFTTSCIRISSFVNILSVWGSHCRLLAVLGNMLCNMHVKQRSHWLFDKVTCTPLCPIVKILQNKSRDLIMRHIYNILRVRCIIIAFTRQPLELVVIADFKNWGSCTTLNTVRYPPIMSIF